MDKYIGEKKVKEFNELDGKIQYTLEDGTGDTVTKEQFDRIIEGFEKDLAAGRKLDDGMTRIYKWMPAVEEIMAILLKNHMMLIEKDFVMGRVDATIVENYQKASAKMFGAKFEYQITLNQIHKALMERNNKMSEETPAPAAEPTPEAPKEIIVD